MILRVTSKLRCRGALAVIAGCRVASCGYALTATISLGRRSSACATVRRGEQFTPDASRAASQPRADG